jgi:dGTPase
VKRRQPQLREPHLHQLIIRDIIDEQVRDVVESSAAAIAKAGLKSADDVRQFPEPLVCYSDSRAAANSSLRHFLYQNVYYHPRVAEVNRRACEMLREVFEAYVLAPLNLGEGSSKRLETEGLHRTVCDYVAGMTDRYLIEEHARLRSVGA